MKCKWLIIFVFSLVSCSTKYVKLNEKYSKYLDTPVTKSVVKDTLSLEFIVEETSFPTQNNPYLTLKFDVISSLKIEKYHKYYRINDLKNFVHFLNITSGMLIGGFLYWNGFVALGKDIVATSILLEAGFILYERFFKISEKWRPEGTRIIKTHFKPDEYTFTLSLQNGNFITSVVPNTEGIVKFDVRELASFYTPGRDLHLIVYDKHMKPLKEIVLDSKSLKEIFRKNLEVAKLESLVECEIDKNIPRTGNINRKAVAVIIANESYQHVENVKYAIHDGEVVKEYFEKVLGIPPENIIYSTNTTKGEMEIIFGNDRDYRGELYNYIEPDITDVYVYYVGHGFTGFKSSEKYLVPVEAQIPYIDKVGYSTHLLCKNLSKLDVERITLIIDACFSGLYPEYTSDSIVRVRSLLKNAALARVIPEEWEYIDSRFVIITGSRGNEVAFRHPERQHSLFTYYFLKGLKGEGDIDGDGLIRVGEIELYLKRNVPIVARKIFGIEQNPEVIGDRDRVLVRLRD